MILDQLVSLDRTDLSLICATAFGFIYGYFIGSGKRGRRR